MEPNHKLALYIAYYLSRFDSLAYTTLGFGNQNETHVELGKILNVNPHTIKNMRDEFDPLFGHRVGWYQRPISPSRTRVVLAFENLDEIQIHGIVNDIISGKIQEDEQELNDLLNIITVDHDNSTGSKFILRAPTGKAAEEFFIDYYSENKQPADGDLIDCRDQGVGYDFKIESGTVNYFVEVKGLSDFTGGILFTDKEWRTSKVEGDQYFLCMVSNLGKKPEISFIQNPHRKLKASKNIYTTIQISWGVAHNQLVLQK